MQNAYERPRQVSAIQALLEVELSRQRTPESSALPFPTEPRELLPFYEGPHRLRATWAKTQGSQQVHADVGRIFMRELKLAGSRVLVTNGVPVTRY